MRAHSVSGTRPCEDEALRAAADAAGQRAHEKLARAGRAQRLPVDRALAGLGGPERRWRVQARARRACAPADARPAAREGDVEQDVAALQRVEVQVKRSPSAMRDASGRMKAGRPEPRIDGRDRDVQTVEQPRGEEVRDGDAAALDEDPRQPARGEARSSAARQRRPAAARSTSASPWRSPPARSATQASSVGAAPSRNRRRSARDAARGRAPRERGSGRKPRGSSAAGRPARPFPRRRRRRGRARAGGACAGCRRARRSTGSDPPQVAMRPSRVCASRPMTRQPSIPAPGSTGSKRRESGPVATPARRASSAGQLVSVVPSSGLASIAWSYAPAGFVAPGCSSRRQRRPPSPRFPARPAEGGRRRHLARAGAAPQARAVSASAGV